MLDFLVAMRTMLVGRVTRNRNDEGATAVEYGLMVALIAGVIVAAVFALGGTVRDAFTNTNDCVASATTPTPDC
jgi:pilus assembly protein Flp/PilA